MINREIKGQLKILSRFSAKIIAHDAIGLVDRFAALALAPWLRSTASPIRRAGVHVECKLSCYLLSS